VIDVRNQVGRLIEVVFETPTTSSEWRELAKQLRSIHSQSTERYMYCANMAKAKLFQPEEVILLKRIMEVDNSRLLRSAMYLGSNSAVLLLQMERLIREAASPARKTFRDPQKLISWMSEVATSDEEQRIREIYSNLQEHKTAESL